jgi:hypothetical protein
MSEIYVFIAEMQIFIAKMLKCRCAYCITYILISITKITNNKVAFRTAKSILLLKKL